MTWLRSFNFIIQYQTRLMRKKIAQVINVCFFITTIYHNTLHGVILYSAAFTLNTQNLTFNLNYACVKGHLEPTYLKSSPLFTFSTKLLGQDSPSVHLFSKTIGSRLTAAKIKLGVNSLC